jgi:hypothetical protein
MCVWGAVGWVGGWGGGGALAPSAPIHGMCNACSARLQGVRRMGMACVLYRSWVRRVCCCGVRALARVGVVCVLCRVTRGLCRGAVCRRKPLRATGRTAP